MTREPTLTTVESETHNETHALFLDNLLASAERLPRGNPNTYGATPLDRVATLTQQIELAASLQVLVTYGLPDDIPADVKDYVKLTFNKRFHGRAEANEENYTTALKSKSDFNDDPILQGIITRAELGQASPIELLVVRQVLGIRSVELACLTHPYGVKERMDILPPMRDAVRQHVELFGGNYYDEPETRYRVKEVVGDTEGAESFRSGLVMTRKRTLGSLYDGTVIRERSSFLLRTDALSILTDQDIEALRGVDMSKKSYQDELIHAAHLDEIAETLLEMDEFTQAIPISSTIYAYNPITTELIEARDAKLTEERRAKFAKMWPHLAEAAKRGVILPEPTKEFGEPVGGMFYIGPELKN